MCGIFGGYNVSFDVVKKGINLIKRGNDGITVAELDKKIIFAARRHTIKFSGYENKLQERSDQPYQSENKDISSVSVYPRILLMKT